MPVGIDITFYNGEHWTDAVMMSPEYERLVSARRVSDFRKVPGVKRVYRLFIDNKFASVITTQRKDRIIWREVTINGVEHFREEKRRFRYEVLVSNLGTLCNRNGGGVDDRGWIVTPAYTEGWFLPDMAFFVPDEGELARIGCRIPAQSKWSRLAQPWLPIWIK
jgi:hypothetical protein